MNQSRHQLINYIAPGTPDTRVLEAVELCRQLSDKTI